jgi:hypothetical protein
LNTGSRNASDIAEPHAPGWLQSGIRYFNRLEDSIGFTELAALALLLCPIAFSQNIRFKPLGSLAVRKYGSSRPSSAPPATQALQPPSYANHSIMLVGPPGSIAVVLMHNPKNELEFVEVNNTNQARLLYT